MKQTKPIIKTYGQKDWILRIHDKLIKITQGEYISIQEMFLPKHTGEQQNDERKNQ